MWHRSGMSSQITKIIAAFGLMGTLVACGGGGGGGDGTPPVNPGPDPTLPTAPTPDQSGDDMRAARAALVATYADPPDYTDLSAIPTRGDANYQGYFSGNLANTSDSVTDTLIGQIDMDVTFTSTSVDISGDVDRFVDDDNDDLTGSLTLTGGRLDRDGNPSNDATLVLTASGTLTDDRGRDLNIGTQLEGDFLGTGHRAVGGEVLGSVTVNGNDQDFDGSFIAER